MLSARSVRTPTEAGHIFVGCTQASVARVPRHRCIRRPRHIVRRGRTIPPERAVRSLRDAAVALHASIHSWPRHVARSRGVCRLHRPIRCLCTSINMHTGVNSRSRHIVIRHRWAVRPPNRPVPCDHRTRHAPRWRYCCPTSSISSQNCSTIRRNPHRVRDGRIMDLIWRQVRCRPLHWQSILQGPGWHRCESSGPVEIRIVIKPVRRMPIKVIDIRNARIADVHRPEVSEPGVIPRIERFTPSQRTPAEAPAEPKTEVHAPARSTKPRNQSGCIYRSDIRGSRRPAPRAAVVDPAPIVERSKAPRSIIHPGPAPGLDPRPMSISIRRPIRRDSRLPYRTIVRCFGPDSVIVEILGPDHSRGNVLCRNRRVLPSVAYPAPAVKAVKSRRLGHRVLQRVPICEAHLVVCLDLHGWTIARSVAFALAHGHYRRIPVWIHIDSVVA